MPSHYDDENKKPGVSIPRTVGRILRAGVINPAVGVYQQRVEDLSRGIGNIVRAGTEFGAGLTGEPVAGEPGFKPPPDTSGEAMKAAARTYVPTTPLGQTPPPPDPTTAPRAPVYDAAETAVPGVRKIVGEEGVPLFTNIAGPASKAHMAGGFGLSPAAEAERVGLARQEFNRSIAAQTKANAELFEAKQAASMGIPTDQFQRIKAKRQGTPEGAATALSLGTQESLARGISPQALQAATQGLAALQPEPVQGPDLGDYASLLNAQTAQGQLGLGEERLAQDRTIAENRAAATAQGDAVKLATQSATNLQGVIDPARFRNALAEYSNLFGITPAGGVGAPPLSEEDYVSAAVAKGHRPEDARALYRQRAGSTTQ